MTDRRSFPDASKAQVLADYDEVLRENLRLRAQNTRLREALEAVVYDADGYCPWCAEYVPNGHAPDCQRQAALKED